MKRQTASFLVAALSAVASVATAGEFHSAVITDTALTINVPDERFLSIQNFTQNGSSSPRGVVSVTANGATNNVLTAAMIDSGSPTPEFIKSVRIAGPAEVTVNPVSGAKLFITYRKRVEPPDTNVTPTPTPTATPTPTPTPTPAAASIAVFETTTLNSEISGSPTPTSTPVDRPSPTPRSTPTPTPTIATPSPQPTVTPSPSLTPR